MNRRSPRLLAALVVAACLGIVAQQPTASAAVPPPFDSTFGTNGKAHLKIPLQKSVSAAVQLLRDGNSRILALFVADPYSSKPKTIIGRYTADGAVDTTYANGGQTTPLTFRASAMAVGPNGQLVVAGFTIDGSRPDLVVYRLNESGSIDRSFGRNGSFTLNSFPGKDFEDGELALTVSPVDGRVFLGFNVRNSTSSNVNFYFIALTHEGFADWDWGNSGGREVVPRATGASAWSRLTNMIVMSDGSLLAVGSAFGAFYREIVLVKLTANGILDPSFDGTTNGNGLVMSQFASESDAVMTAINVLSDGSIVVAGLAGTYYYGPWYYGIAKFQSDGTPANSFGTGGFALSQLQSDFNSPPPKTVLQLTNNELIFPVNDGSSIGFMRVSENGAFTSSLGCSTCLWDTTSDNVDALSLAVQSDGKPILAGVVNSTNDAIIGRFLTNGTLDSTFQNIPIEFRLEKWDAFALKSTVLADGSIITLGQGRVLNSKTRPVIFKTLPDGSPDQQFGAGGYVMLNPPSDDGAWFVWDMVVQPDGKIVVLGNGWDYGLNISPSLTMWRVNPDGSSDNSFGTNGFQLTSDPNADLEALSLALLPTGKFLVSVTQSGNSPTRPWIYRFTSSGALDSSFTDSNGIAGAVQPTANEGNGYSVRIHPTGTNSVYISGATTINGDEHMYLARLLPDGTLDPTFASGRLTWEISQPNAFDDIVAVHVGDGGILTVLGNESSPTQTDVVMQFLPNGNVNPTFTSDGTGRMTFVLRNPNQVAYTFSRGIIASGSSFIVAGGGEVDSDTDVGFAAVGKINGGAMDSAYGTSGIVDASPDFDAQFYGITRVNDTTSIVTGYLFDNGQPMGLLMKLSSSMPPTTTTTPPGTVPPTTTPTTTPPTTVPVVDSSSSDDIALTVTATQAAILKRLKLSVPAGGKVSMRSMTPRICRVSRTNVLASAPGTCRVSVTISVKGKKTTKSLAIRVR